MDAIPDSGDLGRWFTPGLLYELAGVARGPVADLAVDFACRGGKHLRPRLLALVFEALAVEPPADPASLGRLLVAVEFFHKASLIHDDIEDHDPVRYGCPSVPAAVGVPLAVDAGDWLVATGYGLIVRSGFAAVPAMLAAAVESHRSLCEGQGDELAGLVKTPEQVLSVYARKTGEAFALPAVLGGLAAGADAKVLAALRSFALSYGVAFQIHDDASDGGHLLLDACGGDAAALREREGDACRAAALAAAHCGDTALQVSLSGFLEELGT